MTYNDEGEVAGAVVLMLKGENASLVVKRVKDKIAEIQKMLPEGVVIEPFSIVCTRSTILPGNFLL